MVLLPRSRLDAAGLGYSAFARHYSRNHCCFLLLWVLRCFSSPRSPPHSGIPAEAGGLPHSETRGSRAICASPRLIAAYRVLRRLREPRHPPSALSHFLASPTGFPGRRHICLVTRMISLPCSQHVNDLSPVLTGYVENNGFEPLTLCLQSRCSSQLS